MLKDINDIHKRYIRNINELPSLILSEDYSYEFVHIDYSDTSSLIYPDYTAYFFVFVIEKEEPFSVYINIIPSTYLDIVQITTHSSIRFHYFDMSHFTKSNHKIIINNQISIEYDEVYEQFSAIIQNQVYIYPSPRGMETTNHVKINLFRMQRNSINQGVFYSKNFDLQKEILDLEMLDAKEVPYNKIKNHQKQSAIGYLKSELKHLTFEYPQPVTAREYKESQSEKKNSSK